MGLRSRHLLLPALLLALLASTVRAGEITANEPTEEGYERAKEAMKQAEIARAEHESALGHAGDIAGTAKRLREARNAAIRIVDEVYGITPPKGLEGEPEVGTGGIGWGTDRDGWSVTIKGWAFESPDGTLSPGWLAANKIEAFVHVQQQWDGRHHIRTPRGASDEWKVQEWALNWVEAYDAVLDEADDLGLSNAERAHYVERRSRRYSALTEENRRKADARDYSTDPFTTDPERKRGVIVVPTQGTIFVPPITLTPAEPRPENSEPERVPDDDGSQVPEEGGLRLHFQGTNTTHKAKVKIENETDRPHVVDIPTGLLLVPEDPSIQTLMVGVTPPVYVPPRSTGWVLVPALCTDRDKDVPPSDTDLFGVGRDLERPEGGSEPDLSPDLPAEEGARGLPDEGLHRRLRIVAITTERYLRERYAFFERPTEDPPGPYERANPPDEPMLVNGRLVVNGEPGGDEIRVEGGRPIPLTPEPRTVLGQAGDGEPFGLLVPGTEEPEPGPATFADAVRTQSIWALTNGDGKADREQIAEESRKQFEAQGASEEQAKRAAEIVAGEIGDAVDEVIEQARDLEDEPELSFRIDATLKGNVAPH